MHPCLSPYPEILSILGYLGYPRMVPGVSMSVPLFRNTKYPGILGISQDGPGCIHVFPLIPKYLVSRDTRDVPGLSQMHPCLSPYPEILSILGYLGYPGMVPGVSMSVPLSRNTKYPGILGISRDGPGCIHVFPLIPEYLVSRDTWDIAG